MKRIKVIVAVAVISALLLGFHAGRLYAAGNAGSRDDPLITQSYLNDVFKPSLDAYINNRVNEATDALTAVIDAELEGYYENVTSTESGFVLVTVYRGQTLELSAGAELLLRDGSATTVSVFSDISGGNSLSPDSIMTLNHLYMTGSGGGNAYVTSDEATVLISGLFEIKS